MIAAPMNRALRSTLLGLTLVVLVTNVLLELNRYHYGPLIGLWIIAFFVWLYLARLGRR